MTGAITPERTRDPAQPLHLNKAERTRLDGSNLSNDGRDAVPAQSFHTQAAGGEDAAQRAQPF